MKLTSATGPLGLSQKYIPLGLFLLFTPAVRILFVWAYNRAQSSILATLLFHTSVNLSLTLFPLVVLEANGDQRGYAYFVVLSILAAIAIVMTQRFRGLSVFCLLLSLV